MGNKKLAKSAELDRLLALAGFGTTTTKIQATIRKGSIIESAKSSELDRLLALAGFGTTTNPHDNKDGI